MSGLTEAMQLQLERAAVGKPAERAASMEQLVAALTAALQAAAQQGAAQAVAKIPAAPAAQAVTRPRSWRFTVTRANGLIESIEAQPIYDN